MTERRISTSQFERSGLPPGNFIIGGLACPFDASGGHDGSPSRRYAPGAFRHVIEGGTVALTFEYMDEVTLAAGERLRLWETANGLMFEARLEANQASWVVVNGINNGTIKHTCTYGESARERVEPDGSITIASVDDLKIAILVVCRPAFPQTWIELGHPFFVPADPALPPLGLASRASG
jgi:hypothetical protein